LIKVIQPATKSMTGLLFSFFGLKEKTCNLIWGETRIISSDTFVSGEHIFVISYIDVKIL